MELQRISLNNNKQSFGAVRFPSWANMTPAKKAGIKVQKGLDWDHERVFLYAFPKKEIEAQFAKKSHGQIVSDDLAKAHIRHRKLDAISDFFERTFHKRAFYQEKFDEMMSNIREFNRLMGLDEKSAAAAEKAECPWNATEVVDGKTFFKFGPKIPLD